MSMECFSVVMKILELDDDDRSWSLTNLKTAGLYTSKWRILRHVNYVNKKERKKEWAGKNHL